jgi:hypothetical protein
VRIFKRIVAASLLAAIVACVPIPGQGPQPNPSATPQDAMAQIILHANNMQSYWVGGYTKWSIPAKGIVVDKINADIANSEDSAIVAAENQGPAEQGIPRSVALALMMSESDLDPLCQNGNFLGSNPTHDPLGFDDGVTQAKLRYLVGSAPGVTDATSAQAFAFDPSRSIPYFYRELAVKIAWAQYIIATYPSLGDTRLHNPYMLGVLGYKQGATGAMNIYNSGSWPTELDNFVNLESYFAQQLGVPSALVGP